jgi:small membrane protein
MIIRVLLLTVLAAIGWFVFLRRNKMPFHIVTVFLLLVSGAVAVITPQTTDHVAQFVGVERGADLIVYLSIVAIFFVLIHYYTKFTELQRNVTHLAREIAILRADIEQGTAVQHRPPTANPSPPAVSREAS